MTWVDQPSDIEGNYKGRLTKGMFTSKRQNWRTPKVLYEELDKEFHFDFDPCLLEKDTIHPKDMLGSDWEGKTIFVNPPYKELEKWIRKCWEEAQKGKLIVMLIPARTDTKAFHRYIYIIRQ